jgi:hypothetical protein
MSGSWSEWRRRPVRDRLAAEAADLDAQADQTENAASAYDKVLTTRVDAEPAPDFDVMGRAAFENSETARADWARRERRRVAAVETARSGLAEAAVAALTDG